MLPSDVLPCRVPSCCILLEGEWRQYVFFRLQNAITVIYTDAVILTTLQTLTHLRQIRNVRCDAIVGADETG